MIDYKLLYEQFKQPFTSDNVKIGSLFLNVVLLFLLCFGAYSYHHNCKGECPEGVVSIVHDTIYPKDKPQVIYAGKPEPVKQKLLKGKRKATLYASQPTISEVKGVDKGQPKEVAIIEDKQGNPCDDLTTYVWDTIIPDQAHITINEEVVGYVNWRSIEYANLTPKVTTTITKVKPEKVKVYVGVAGTFNGTVFNRWGIGPQGFVSIPKIGGVSYYYDAHNNAHTAGFLALIRFKK